MLGNVSAVGSPSTDSWLQYARFKVYEFGVFGFGVLGSEGSGFRTV